MGGKNYFCDYCNCYMKNDLNVRKTHNSGLTHAIAKANYVRSQMEDPFQVLEIESAKVPCTRYHSKGYCKFELYCQYSHYTPAQLVELRKICMKMTELAKKKKSNSYKEVSKRLLKSLPWNAQNHKQVHCKRKRATKLLPPSLRQYNLRKMLKHRNINEWGLC